MRVIIAGSRDYSNREELYSIMDKLLSKEDRADITIICGCARGADMLGAHYGLDRKYNIEFFTADWDGLGKKAGPIRNTQMAESATACVVFWDGQSRGSKHMMDTAKAKGLIVRVVQDGELKKY